MTASLSQRVATMLQSGHRFDYELRTRSKPCPCGACLRQAGMLDELLGPGTRRATLRLLAQARRYAYWLTRSGLLIDRAVWYERGEPERARQHRARLEDTLGPALIDTVRRRTARAYGDEHGRCLGALLGWCGCGQVTYNAPWSPGDHAA